MTQWIETEFKTLLLGDKRLDNRAKEIIDTLYKCPSKSVVFCANKWSQVKATYRFWDSPKVKPAKLLKPHTDATFERMSDAECVLIAQDTCSLNYTHHPQTEGLGYLEGRYLKGIFMHTALAISTEGVPYGIVAQKIWERDETDYGKRHQRHSKPIDEKESYRWLELFKQCIRRIKPHQQCITVADREADILEFLMMPRPGNAHLLIRACRNRLIKKELCREFSKVDASPEIGMQIVDIARSNNLASRKAKLYLKSVTLNLKNKDGSAVPINLIHAYEKKSPSGIKPISWYLLTTLRCGTIQEIMTCVGYYSYRWLIERYHYVLKSGCRVEDLQLKSAMKLENAIATYCVIAWRVMWLIYNSRQTPKASCCDYFTPLEQKILYLNNHKSRVLPDKPPNLANAVLWTAKLGCFIGRKGDGNPGLKSLWQGLEVLAEMVRTWNMLSDHDLIKIVGNA